MKSFARQLKKGGTVAIAHYRPCYIIDNPEARAIWQQMFTNLVDIMNSATGHWGRAIRNASAELDTVPFPLEDWEPGAKRIVINYGGPEKRNTGFTAKALQGPDRVGPSDVKEFIEDDENVSNYPKHLTFVLRTDTSFPEYSNESQK